MKKLLIACLFVLGITGCQGNSGPNVEEIVSNLYSESYKVMSEAKEENDSKKALEKEFKEIFTEEKLSDLIATNVFFNLNETAVDSNAKIEVTDVKLDETGENQYFYEISFDVNIDGEKTKENSSGSIRFDEDGKISFWKIASYPEYSAY